MTISTLDDIIAAYTGGQVLEGIAWRKASTAAETSGWPHSLWRVGPMPPAGGDGAAGSGTPGAGGTALDLADGSLSQGWADQSPDQKILLDFNARTSASCILVLVDRLVSVSGIALSSTGNKNVGSVALPRYTSGVGVQAWLEVTTATATTAPVVSMNSYTDQSGNTGSAGGTITFPAAATNVDTLVPLPFATGDYGVRACATVNVATAGTAGVANFVLTKEILRIPLATNLGRGYPPYIESMAWPIIEDGASLMLYMIPGATLTVTFDGGPIRGVYG